MEKRGLSNIIVTLLIIVLSLVAISIVWGITRNIIIEGSEQIELGKFTLDLEIKSVKVQGDDVTVDVIVKRNPGPGEFIGINFVFFDGQNSEVIREDTILKELEEKSFTYTLTKISTSELEDVSIAPIYELRSGKEDMGNIADKFKVSVTGGVISEALGGNFEKLGFIGAGKKEYNIPSQSKDIVKFSKAVVDPLDVLPGDNQTFTVYVSSIYGIINVTTTTELDNSTLTLPLELQPDSSWSATWTVNDVHATTYRTTFTATDSQGNSNSITLTWTDSCQSLITHGADSTISSSCSTGASTIAGIDGGSLTIGAGVTLTIDSGSQLIFNTGKSITITASGASIVSTSTGSFGNGNLYYTDADGDFYTDGTTLKTSSSNGIRASSGSILGTSDCGDANTDIYRNIANLVSDNDQDGYSDTSPFTICVGDSTTVSGRTYYADTGPTFIWLASSQSLGTDCNDADSGVLDLEWSAPAADGTCCEDGSCPSNLNSQQSGACSPLAATNDYITGDIFCSLCCGPGPDEFDNLLYRFTQTCNSC